MSQESVLPANIQRLVESIDDVPALPEAVVEFEQVSADPDAPARRVAEAIAKDQALTGRLLRLVNSAFYGFSGRIGTVEHAVIVMGSSAVRAAVMGAAVFSALGRDASGEACEGFMVHATLTADAMKSLAGAYGAPGAEELHTAALLHDIGKLLILARFPDEHQAIVEHGRKTRLPSIVGERKHLGATHAELGGWLADKWKLPPMLRAVIHRHHSVPDDGDFALQIALAQAADAVAHQAARLAGEEGVEAPLSTAAWVHLIEFRPDIEQEDHDAIAETLSQRMDTVRQAALALS